MILLLFLVCGLACRSGTHTRASSLFAGYEGAVNVLGFGAKPDGKSDCTQAFQQAIDFVQAAGGGLVFAPAGKFFFKGHLTLSKGVHLAGVNQAPQSWEPASGTLLLPAADRDNETGPAFIELRSSTSIKGISIYYPEQTPGDIKPYPWTIQVRGDPGKKDDVAFDSTLENITLVNSYNGIRIGPTENGRHRISNLNGCVLRRGILVDGTGDVGRIENVQFHCHFWAHPAFGGDWDRVFAYMQQNLEAYLFGMTDWEFVANTFVFPARIGYRFMRTASGLCNGQLNGIAADFVGTAIQVEAIKPQGLFISNGQFNCHEQGESTQVIVEAGCRGNIRFCNCGFWGPSRQNALLLGPAFVSFSDCYFRSDLSTTNYLVEARSGNLQVNNCTFDLPQVRQQLSHDGTSSSEPRAIHLKPGLQSAIIYGNNAPGALSIKNEIGQRAIIQNQQSDIIAN